MCLLTFKHHGKGRYVVKSKAFYIHGFEAMQLTVKAEQKSTVETLFRSLKMYTRVCF